MMTTLIVGLGWFGAIGCGLMAGIYFAFSAFIMTSLEHTTHPGGMKAMQAINDVILRSSFMPLFFSTSLAALLAVAAALWLPSVQGRSWLLAAGIVYVVGMLICTVVFNVPLNNALKAADPDSVAGVAVWEKYVRVWTRWNHLRTLASALASVFFILSLMARA